jgi:soluble lytic murein transglycosylase-like protein
MKRARLAAAAAALILFTPTGVDAQAATCRDYVDLARTVGFPKSERANIRRIMYRESRCRPDAINHADPHGGSWGLMQTNLSNLGFFRREGIAQNKYDLLNPRVNMRAAFALWELYGWRPWRGSSTTPVS